MSNKRKDQDLKTGLIHLIIMIISIFIALYQNALTV